MSCETVNAYALNILLFTLTHFFPLIASKEKQKLGKSLLSENLGKWCKSRKAGLLEDHYGGHSYFPHLHDKLLDFIW